MPSRRNVQYGRGGSQNEALLNARARKRTNRIARRLNLVARAEEKRVHPDVIYLRDVREWSEKIAGQRQQTRTRASTTSIALLPAYTSLPRALLDGECTECHHWPNPRKLIETSGGMRTGHQCSQCGTLMRLRFE